MKIKTYSTTNIYNLMLPIVIYYIIITVDYYKTIYDFAL